ncbi:MAG: PfkB family carbohydrate kinase [Anaerolineae bacterium]
MNRPDYLVIGAVTKDIVPQGYRPGGTVTYSSVTVQSLGLQAGVVTRADPTMDFSLLTDRGIWVASAPSAQTTTFENIYVGDRRTQYVRAVAEPITADHVPAAWRSAPIVHLGPLAQEMDEAIVELFPHALIGVTPQGWMRQWDGTGKVSPKVWERAEYLLPRADVLVISEEDIGGNLGLVEFYIRLARIVVVTNGWKGSTVYANGECRQLPPRATREVDPTGAGDVYAAAYLVALHEQGDPFAAARFANVVASFSVEALGVDGIPTRQQVVDYLTQHGEA